MADLRRELPKRFPQLQFFFQPADIVNQVLNFGQPAPIDIRVSGPNRRRSLCGRREDRARPRRQCRASSTRTCSRSPTRRRSTVDVDRTLAREVGLGQRDAADNLLVSLNNSAQVAPNFWLNPRNGVSYPLVVQTPTYSINIGAGFVDAAA